MNEKGTPEMHSEFPRWYRSVSLGDDRELFQRRWQGIAAFVEDLNEEDIESMIRIIFRSRAALSDDAVNRIRKPFKEADELFDMHGNDREMEVLSGITFAVLFEKGVDIAAIAALAVTTAGVGGARSLTLPMDLYALAEQSIGMIAEENRKRPQFKKQMLAGIKNFNFDDANSKIKEQADFNGVQAAFGSAATIVKKVLTSMVSLLNRTINDVESFLAIQDEELEMLWWVFGERSEELDLDFADIDEKMLPIVLGKELADATQFLPGPSSVKALLSRAGLKDRHKFTIPEFINACDTAWLSSFSKPSNVSPVSQPLHFAIHRKLETGDDSSWISGWAATTEIEQDHVLSMLSIGNLFYRERLLELFSEE